jgi:hypothetical protein
MELITLSIIAAASAGGLIAARWVARRRRPALPAPDVESGDGEQDEGAESEAKPPPSPTEGLPVGLLHVIQVDDDTRWPRRGLLIHHDGRLHGAILMTEENGEEQATVSLAPPAPYLYWLTRRQLAMPPKPPTRIEIDGLLLDRAISFPAMLTAVGDDPPLIGDQGVFCIYDGSVGDGAVVLIADQTFVWYGRRLGAGEWDNLGEVEPED